MRYRSKKTAALYRLHGPARREYAREFPLCMICGAPGTAVHEILSGPYRLKAFAEPACWLSVCSVCNCHDLTNRVLWPVERQLALKLVRDPDRADIEAVNRIWSPRTVDLDALEEWVQRGNDTGDI